ncbi:hypothetical protein EDC04DRAFT_1679412 [Pisolithus marmoratus]|nr:hypothetical protein EDC04DRAFT_1679412 [Pisolithus marmoratus]
MALIMRKARDLEYTAQPLQIPSAFQRDSLPGMIYVEARSSQQVNCALPPYNFTSTSLSRVRGPKPTPFVFGSSAEVSANHHRTCVP